MYHYGTTLGAGGMVSGHRFHQMSSGLDGTPFLLIRVSCGRVHGVRRYHSDNDFTVLF